MSGCVYCRRNLMCPAHPPVFTDDSYSLGFKEGVMWVSALESLTEFGMWESHAEWAFYNEWYFDLRGM